MKLKGTVSPAVTLPVKIKDTFVVQQRHVPRKRSQDLARANTSQEFNAQVREFVELVDDQKYFNAMVKEYIAGWSGLTPEILLHLAPTNDNEELDVPDPVDEGDGKLCIPCDHSRVVLKDDKRAYTLPEYLWSRAWPMDFSEKLEWANRNFQDGLDKLALEKKVS